MSGSSWNFDGDRSDFDLPLDLDSGSAFQRRVWEVIARIPRGEVMSYAEVAQAAGQLAHDLDDTPLVRHHCLDSLRHIVVQVI